jgi:serine protease AprX
MDEAKVDEIAALSFVNKATFVAPGSKMINALSEGRVAKVKKSSDVLNEGSESNAQNAFIGVDAMHEKGYLGEGMLIAVFDSGFEFVDQSSYFTHVFSDNKIVGTRDFIRGSSSVYQYDTHGSKVLSCISAYNEGEFTGTAPESDLVLCVTEDVMSEYAIEEYNWLFAAEYADSIGVDIINTSVGYSYFDDPEMDYTYEDMDGNTAVITQAADIAASKGLLVVSSNGNEGNSDWQYLNAPSDGDSVLAIGAVTSDSQRSNFSSFGPSYDGRIKPDVSALGSWVRVVYKDEVSYANGTSFSAPMVAGLAAGFWQAFPELTNMEVIQYLKMTASHSDAPDTTIGYGIPDFIRAYNRVKNNESDIVNKFVVFPNPVTNKRTIYFYIDSLTTEGKASLTFFDLKGSYIRTKELEVKNLLDAIEVDVSFLNPGSYILTYLQGSVKKKSKLVVL